MAVGWVDWFNHRRVLELIGHVPPAEFEQEYYRQQSGQAVAALDSNHGVSGIPGAVQIVWHIDIARDGAQHDVASMRLRKFICSGENHREVFTWTFQISAEISRAGNNR